MSARAVHTGSLQSHDSPNCWPCIARALSQRLPTQSRTALLPASSHGPFPPRSAWATASAFPAQEMCWIVANNDVAAVQGGGGGGGGWSRGGCQNRLCYCLLLRRQLSCCLCQCFAGCQPNDVCSLWQAQHKVSDEKHCCLMDTIWQHQAGRSCLSVGVAASKVLYCQWLCLPAVAKHSELLCRLCTA